MRKLVHRTQRAQLDTGRQLGKHRHGECTERERETERANTKITVQNNISQYIQVCSVSTFIQALTAG